MTPTDALARITALCDSATADGWNRLQLVTLVRAVLAELTPEAGGTLDRDQAREVLLRLLRSVTGHDHNSWLLGAELDALAACVRPATIDRDALMRVLAEEHWNNDEAARVAERIVALVQPAEAT